MSLYLIFAKIMTLMDRHFTAVLIRGSRVFQTK